MIGLIDLEAPIVEWRAPLETLASFGDPRATDLLVEAIATAHDPEQKRPIGTTAGTTTPRLVRTTCASNARTRF